MFSQIFYHGTIRKYVILFGTLFNEIYIRRGVDEECTDADTIIRVPITYGPKDKILKRPELDENFTLPFAAILPRMSFEMLNMYYDSDRKIKTLGRNVGVDTNNDIAKYVYNAVPWNFTFKLTIMIKNAEDGTKIIEQILPYFTPEWTTTVKIIDDPEIVLDIPVVLNGEIANRDTWEGDFTQRRYLEWDIVFTLKGYLFGPVKRDKIIKIANTNISFDPFSNNQPLVNTATSYGRVTVTPGLLANGSPTSNADATLNYSQIDWEDDYGFVVETETFPNGQEE